MKKAMILFSAGWLFVAVGLLAQEKSSLGEFAGKILADFESEPAVELAKFRMPEACAGKLEIVPGKSGKNGLKITFLPGEKTPTRYVNFAFRNTPELDPKNWVKEKYKTLKFWVKGDGSDNTVVFDFSMGYDPEAKRWKTGRLASFSLENTDWQLITIPLESKYDLLKKADGMYFYSVNNSKGFSYTIDKFTAVSD